MNWSGSMWPIRFGGEGARQREDVPAAVPGDGLCGAQRPHGEGKMSPIDTTDTKVLGGGFIDLHAKQLGLKLEADGERLQSVFGVQRSGYPRPLIQTCCGPQAGGEGAPSREGPLSWGKRSMPTVRPSSRRHNSDIRPRSPKPPGDQVPSVLTKGCETTQKTRASQGESPHPSRQTAAGPRARQAWQTLRVPATSVPHWTHRWGRWMRSARCVCERLGHRQSYR